MNLSFENKVALVTGAAAVVLADFNEDAAKAEAQKLVPAGRKAIRCPLRCE
jgi:hypothetical protein